MKGWAGTAFVIVVLLHGCGPDPYADFVSDPAAFMIFHNNSGPMCLEARAWLEDTRAQYPTLQVEEHLVTQPAEAALMVRLTQQLPVSQGVSTSYEYLPIIFFQGQAFSGFNDGIRASLEALLEQGAGAVP